MGKLLLNLAGCRDLREFAKICPLKKKLCKNKRFGPAVRKQCPATCGICQKTKPTRTKLKVKCNPKPLVKAMPAKLMKASSSLGKGRGPERARLHSLTTPWVAGRQRKGQWLQVT